jgi:hypothetical protein
MVRRHGKLLDESLHGNGSIQDKHLFTFCCQGRELLKNARPVVFAIIPNLSEKTPV